jgi:hypothetical protein
MDCPKDYHFHDDVSFLSSVGVPKRLQPVLAGLYAERCKGSRRGTEIIGEIYGGEEFLIHIDSDDRTNPEAKAAMVAEGWPEDLVELLCRSHEEDYIRIYFTK